MSSSNLSSGVAPEQLAGAATAPEAGSAGGGMVARPPRARVVGYLRVSSDQQAEHGHGLDYQRRAIEVWAANNGVEVVTFLEDAGVSGREGLDGREGLPLAIGMVADGVAQGIVVYKLDRLARDVTLQELLLSELRRHGGRLYSCMAGENENLEDDGDPTRKLVRVILGAIAEHEGSMIAMRMRMGKVAKRAKGGYIGGTAPYGTMPGPKGELIPNPDEVPTVELIVELRGQGLSYEKIAGELNTRGIPSRSGKAWYKPGVRNIVLRVTPSLAHWADGRPIGTPGR